MYLKKYLLPSLFCLLFVVLLLFNLFRVSHPAIEFDEGVYISTFQLANAGHPLYQETFFSQFPGFFVAVNPFFRLLGQTLQAGRVGVFFWSMIGISILIWIGYEIELPLFSIIAIASLYLMPLYQTEILTFHADSLPSVFSLFALVTCLRFTKMKQTVWLVLSACSLAVAVLIKLDLTIIPSLIILIVLSTKKRVLQTLTTNGLLFLTCFCLMLLCITIPFGLGAIANTVIPFRTLVTTHSGFNPKMFLILLWHQPALLFFLFTGLALTAFTLKKKYGRNLIHIVLLLWVITTSAVLFVYHPLFDHHFFLLAIPAAMLFSYAAAELVKHSLSTNHIASLTCILLIIFLGYQIVVGLKTPQRIEVNNEAIAEQIVNQTTNPTDYVISDDGIINGLTRRLAPPNLSDLSFVRISSGDISPESFEKTLAVYKPKLIISWTYRISSLPDFAAILGRNSYKLLYQNSIQQKIYIRSS